jgi:hypothetical protein
MHHMIELRYHHLEMFPVRERQYDVAQGGRDTDNVVREESRYGRGDLEIQC